MKLNVFNIVARAFTTRSTSSQAPQSAWALVETMESRTMLSSVPTGTVTFIVDGVAQATTTTHRGGANFALCDGSVRF